MGFIYIYIYIYLCIYIITHFHKIKIQIRWSIVTPRYEIFDPRGKLLFRIEGIFCYCKCFADVPFKVFMIYNIIMHIINGILIIILRGTISI